MTLGTWWRILRENRWQVDRGCRRRALVTTLYAAVNSVLAFTERVRFAESWAGVEVREPLFVLGHWRSGTTHLHNLLSQDPQWAFPNLYQVWNPLTFLSNEGIQARLQSRFLPADRSLDEVEVSFDLPYEDEMIGWHSSGRSPYLGYNWPRNLPFYDRYLTMDEVEPAELAAWRDSLLTFCRKLTHRYGRRLLLKSPQHTARVRLLLELFPDARFLFIHRDPGDVYRSTERLHRIGFALAPLQHTDGIDLDSRILNQYEQLHEAYERDRVHIPEGRLYELGFAALKRDPLGTLQACYQALALDGFDAARPQIEHYVATLAGYQQHAHAPLDAATRSRLEARWARWFSRFGYASP